MSVNHIYQKILYILLILEGSISSLNKTPAQAFTLPADEKKMGTI